jgi:ApaG protein
MAASCRRVITARVPAAVTEGIRVSVKTEYRADRSSPSARRYLFTYTIRISNDGDEPAKLVSRHWYITDANGDREEVEGDGVVGQQPRLAGGESFEYTSFCVLRTPLGQMRGTYRMERDDGPPFEAEIPAFSLSIPGTLN